MWRYALLGTASLVAASNGTPNNAKRYDNSSVLAVSSGLSLPRPAYSVTDVASSSNITASIGSLSPVSDYPSSQKSGYSVVDVAPSNTTVTVIHIQESTVSAYATDQPSSNASSSANPEGPSGSMKAISLTYESHYIPTLPSISTYVPSRAPYPYENGTKTLNISTSTIAPVSVFRGSCTGCALAALNPITTSYQSNLFGNWTSLVVTETIVTEFVTYMNNATIDTVVTETKTVNQTKTVNEWITDTWANFNIYLPTPGMELTLEVGPTYVLYTNLYGGIDAQINATAPTARNNATLSELRPTGSTCQPRVSSLRNFIPTRTADWDFFIQTFANGSTPSSTAIFSSPVPVPTKLVSFLAQDQDLQVQFQGADINTCTLAGISDMLIGDPNRTFNPPATSPAAPPPPPPPAVSTATETGTRSVVTSFSPPAFSSIPGTNTYLSTTYASTSKHITKQGCLRCDTNAGDRPEETPKPTEYDPNTNNINDDPAPTKTPDPKNDDTPKSNDKPNNNPKTDGEPHDQPQNPQNTPKPDVKTTPSIPDFINSIISNNPDLTKKPAQQPTGSDQTITIGNSVVTVKPQPTKQGPGQQTNAPTMVIIGTQTVTVGQTTTINGVPVVVPTAGGGSTIVVGDQTIGLNPRITQAPLPVLTVGYNTITANPEGQFVIGTQTLQRGGPILVLDDHTLTLGPNGKIAIWNSATQTLVSMNGQPAATFGGESITAKVLGGTTVFILNGQTLGPGSAVTMDGTTFSLPSGFHGSSIVINGQTSRLSAGLPTLTINSSPIIATVASGTTEFVLAPGQTLTPGGELVVSGTTYSLPTSGQGSTIIINGATSRLNPSHLPVLPYGGEQVTATLAHGTTAFIFGPDETLTPGGIVTISGTTISLPASASGSVVVVNGVTSTLDASNGYGPVSAAPIVVDGRTITATTRDGTVEYDIDPSTTLLPDGQVIISGTTYSLVGGTALVANGKTSIISTSPASNSASTTSSSSSRSAESTSERGAGDFIASGIGETSHSRGVGSRGGVDKWAESLLMGMAGWLLWLI